MADPGTGGGQISGTRKHDQGSKRFKEPDNFRERRYRFPEPDVMFKGTKDFQKEPAFLFVATSL
jgi:hypothetical protein